ncbi:hypothetical protein QN372_08835 [Undibacterium sp. RTI2.1]|uniref:hypothetical protein n=1 Tax=unclassified Undibacterium TaxID=2630295 RepID=UPI002AB5A324|nr:MULTISPECIES: hypothetical protein [unclassified Undibacterium]MDY7538911.1 hypothetical protein [Undibacterium sp. 5I1]MEB0030850.1 hypothetical protein [Undibacterium sp. RTI2.1]MEB0117307.1 hypothetical protein [Undibacterium sp. RTI2.2]MEB0232706.1 hypothetical protein [Undibacterium sp. 10I3]MEB0257782.1 hypothetical protein [Undibacterium sp. 5I1]
MPIQFPRHRIKSILLTLSLMLSFTATMPAKAIPVADFRAEDALPILTEFKKNVNLNPNQQLLWQQTESKVRNIFRIRELRRRAIQDAVKASLEKKNTELRDLTKSMDQDEVISLQENQQLRELWLTMYDALDDKQRDMVVDLLMDQLNRVEDQTKDHGSRSDLPKASGGRRGKGGSGGGQGGMGQNVPIGE